MLSSWEGAVEEETFPIELILAPRRGRPMGLREALKQQHLVEFLLAVPSSPTWPPSMGFPYESMIWSREGLQDLAQYLISLQCYSYHTHIV